MKILKKSVLISFIILISSTKGLTESLTDNSIVRAISRVYDNCENSEDIVRCLKIQGAKIAGRALKVHSIKLLDGISFIKRPGYVETQRSSSGYDTQINNNNLDNISPKSLDNIFYDRLHQLISSHQIQINIPRLMKFGQEQSSLFFDGRSKKDKGGMKFFGPFIAAVLLKAAMMKMAFHSIALVAAKALLVGKIALIISAIIGLKKLVSSEGHEKTTYEIVKHPHIQQSHTYSSSHGEYDGHEGGGLYHRSIGDDEMIMSDKAYRAHVPRT